MTSNDRDAPRLVIAFPPLLYVIPFAAGIGADLAAPAPFLPDRLQYALGAALGGIAALIMPFVLREYHKARTHFDPRRPSARLVTTGPYRYSRNPAYLALTLLYLGGSAAVDSLWVLAGAAPAVLAAHWGVILPEERYLEGKFGDAYRGYKRTVRRWL